MLHAVVIHDQHYQIHGLSADLKTNAAARHHEECRSAPTFWRAATGQSTAVFRSHDEAALQHRRHNRDALGRSQYLSRDAFIVRTLNLIQTLGRGLSTIGAVGFFGQIVGRPTNRRKWKRAERHDHKSKEE